MEISFPNLSIDLGFVPKSFTIFGFTIAMYGIIIALAIIAGYYMAETVAKRTGQDPDTYWKFGMIVVVVSIIGARIYYVIFAWDSYKANLLSVFNIREGGLAIYGGVIAAFLTLFIYTRKHHLNTRLMGDTAVPGLALGQAIGRWGNFTNREVFGEYTNNLFAMRLPIEMVREKDISPSILAHVEPGTNYIQVHPTFLYESLWCLILFILMLLYWKHKKFDGEICLLYFAGYGLGRAWIEGIRTDQLFIPKTTIPVSQMLAIVMVIGAAICEIIIRKRLKNNKETRKHNI